MARRPLREEEPASEDVTGALHDVSNALTVLIGWVQEAQAEDATREFVAYALGVVERRARMARDLARRSITRGERGDLEAVAPTADGDEDLETVVADVLASLKVEAERAHLELAREPKIAPAVRIRNPADVSHVLTNLVLNAIAHAPPGSEVKLSVRAGDGGVTIEVADQGPGVPPERATRIFEGDTTRDGGAGVGLRHARAVSRAAGGDLELVGPASRDAGSADGHAGGARFRLTWPRADSRVPPAPSSIARVRPLEGKRVLLLEDDADVIELLDTALEARGADVVVARTRAELLDQLSRGGGSFDAALIDLSPIEADVQGALDALTAAAPLINVVLITGTARALPRGVAEGTLRWVRKPFEVREVVAALAERPRPGESESGRDDGAPSSGLA